MPETASGKHIEKINQVIEGTLDNAAIIGVAGYYEYVKGVRHGYDLNVAPDLKL